MSIYLEQDSATVRKDNMADYSTFTGCVKKYPHAHPIFSRLYIYKSY